MHGLKNFEDARKAESISFVICSESINRIRCNKQQLSTCRFAKPFPLNFAKEAQMGAIVIPKGRFLLIFVPLSTLKSAISFLQSSVMVLPTMKARSKLPKSKVSVCQAS